MKPRFEPSGDAAVVVVMADAPSVDATARIEGIERQLEAADELVVVPALTSLLVAFDPLVTTYLDVVGRLSRAIDDSAAAPVGPVRQWTLPIAYGGLFGPDLDEVASLLGVSADRAADDHASQELSCLAVGFAPGFIYAGLLDARWDIARRNQVHPSIPPGAVSVAVRQTSVTSTTTPTGWSVIGRTPVRNFDPGARVVTPVQAGHLLTFERVTSSEVERLTELMHDGRWAPTWVDQ